MRPQFIHEQEQIDESKVPFNDKLPTVLYILRDTGGCGFYRCLQPALALRRRGMANTITDIRNTTPEHIIKADVVVFQYTGDSKSVEAFNFALSKGKLVIVEVDDYLHSVSPNNPGRAAWSPASLHLHRFEQQVRAAHGMTVSTPQLAREYFPFQKNIFVLPNFLHEAKWGNLHQTKKNDGILRIGWAGGNAHIDDLDMIAPVIERIIREYKGKVKFETMGPTKGELAGKFHLEEFEGICPECSYQGDLKVNGAERMEMYPEMLVAHGWDIGIVPVVDTAFNNAKSDLKLKEYSACGYPMIASNVTPYREAKADGCDVILASNYDEWYNAIKELIDNPERRADIVSQNKEWVSRYWIDDNISKYMDAYAETKKLVQSKNV